jgi:hypothetical protein
LSEYVPAYADYVVWAGLLSTWHGTVSNYDKDTDELHVIFAGLPFLLFTMTNEEMEKETRKIKMNKIRVASKGTWAILQHDYTKNASIWYI